MAAEGDADTQNAACWITCVCAMNCALMIINRHPISCGGPIVTLILGAHFAANAF
jgi:hypothetical protein